MTGQPDTTGPVTVLRVRMADDPAGWTRYYLAPRSLAARMVADAAGGADQAEDIGPVFLLCQAAARHEAGFHLDGATLMVLIGIADGSGRWARWAAPAPLEPVPGSPGASAAAN